MPAKHVPIKDGDLEAKALISADSGRAVNTCLPARLSFFTEESKKQKVSSGGGPSTGVY